MVERGDALRSIELDDRAGVANPLHFSGIVGDDFILNQYNAAAYLAARCRGERGWRRRCSRKTRHSRRRRALTNPKEMDTLAP
jgi:hypothetical protein